MIVELPDTTTNDISKALVTLRDEGGAVALGRVLTLVIDASSSPTEVWEEAIEAANDASREHPCRVIVLAAPHEGGGTLDAQIRVGGDAGASEVVVLRPSTELVSHSDVLITPLLLPDAPIVAWWPREVPGDPSRHPVGTMAQRRITDSTACTDPPRTLDTLAGNYSAGDTDLAWTRDTRWRGLLAAALDQPPYEPVTSAVVRGEAGHPSVELLAGWLAYALRCPVLLETEEGAKAITQARLVRKSGDIVIDRPDGLTATLTQPGQPVRHISMPLRSLRECLAEELRRMDPDEVYGEVLTKGLPKVEGR